MLPYECWQIINHLPSMCFVNKRTNEVRLENCVFCHVDNKEHTFYNQDNDEAKEGDRIMNAVPYMSRMDIENIAAPVLVKYREHFVPKRNLCYNIDPTQLAKVLGVRIQFAYLSRNGSILGQTASAPLWTTVIDPVQGETFFFLDGKTVLIDKCLLTNSTQIGRKNFTIAHELAHLILSHYYRTGYGLRCRAESIYRADAEVPFDRLEWQADVLAAALLLPEDALKDAMFVFGLGEKMNVLSHKYSAKKYQFFCDMAVFFQVSKTTLAYRMEQLGLLERNYLVKEAREKRGVS